MTAPHPLASAVSDLSDLLYRVAREWEAVEQEITDPDQRDALTVALSNGYPLGKDLNDLQAEVAEWAEHVGRVMDARPSVLDLVVAEISDDVRRVTTDLAKEQKGTPTDDAYRVWQNGGLSGEVGRLGGIFTPSVAAQIADLLQAIAGGDPGQIHHNADRFARAYRTARKASQT